MAYPPAISEDNLANPINIICKKKEVSPMKKIIALVISIMLLVPFAAMAQDKVTVGIAQFAVHGSLDNCREGFVQGMAEEGFIENENVVYEVQNAQADMGLAAQIASNFVDNKVDLICAIATPMAVVSANTADGKIPLVYSAVSDPVAAELSNEDGLGQGPITGTSDTLPVAKQLSTIRAMLPEAKTIGILYTVGEVNSQVQLKTYEELAPAQGFTIESMAITTGGDISLAVPNLLSKVDCVTMLLDNTVVQYLDVVLDTADEKKIPVFGSEIEQVVKGCVASEGIDYIALGRSTGIIAARVLKGEDAAAIPFEIFQESKLYINTEKLEYLGIQMPEDLAQDAVAVPLT